jgi:DNA-directed RNA polymerase specialized sigma24 family protein
VISTADAQIIASTRLESLALTDVARQLDVSYDAMRMRRSRAESRLASAIRTGQVGDLSPS